MLLDIWLPTEKIAIELKYPKRELATKWQGELYKLKNNGAQDINRYDLLKDVQRLERVVGENSALRAMRFFCRMNHFIGVLRMRDGKTRWTPPSAFIKVENVRRNGLVSARRQGNNPRVERNRYALRALTKCGTRTTQVLLGVRTARSATSASP